MGFFALTLFVPFISGIQFVFNPNSLQCYCTINELTLALPEVSTIDENFEWMIAVECGDICKHTHTQRERTNNRENEFCKVEDKNTGKSIFPKLLIVFCFFSACSFVHSKLLVLYFCAPDAMNTSQWNSFRFDSIEFGLSMDILFGTHLSLS